MDPGAAESIQAVILPAITTVAERVLQRAIEEYRLQRPELVRTDKYLLDAEASVRLLLSFLACEQEKEAKRLFLEYYGHGIGEYM